jgi:DNA-binding response OmpR family regulator
VVESEVLVRHVLAEFLRECGYRVVEAADADEAVVVLKEAGLAIDVVLAEAQPPANGFALAQWMRTHRPGLHLILAGSVTRAVDAAAELCEGDERLSKPYDPQVVRERIRRLLASRARRSG